MKKSTNCKTRQNSKKYREIRERVRKARAIAIAGADAATAVGGNWWDAYKTGFQVAMEVSGG
jgi:hypothetical protein